MCGATESAGNQMMDSSNQSNNGTSKLRKTDYSRILMLLMLIVFTKALLCRNMQTIVKEYQ